MISFTHSRLYKDIGSNAFFTMATLLMPLLENDAIKTSKSLISETYNSILHQILNEKKGIMYQINLNIPLF